MSTCQEVPKTETSQINTQSSDDYLAKVPIDLLKVILVNDYKSRKDNKKSILNLPLLEPE
jgi:hypothetical protein